MSCIDVSGITQLNFYNVLQPSSIQIQENEKLRLYMETQILYYTWLSIYWPLDLIICD